MEKGSKHSEETKRGMSFARRREKHPRWKRIKTKCLICNRVFFAQEHRVKKGHSKLCSRKCFGEYRKIHFSKENHYNWQNGKTVKIKCKNCKKTISCYPSQIKDRKHKFCSRRCQGEASRKYLHSLNQQIRRLHKYHIWRTTVFQRDHYTCQICDARNKQGNGDTVWLEAHHLLKSFIELLKENNITSIQKAEECDILWDRKLGVTLCKKCHSKFHTLGKQGERNGKEIR